MAGERTPLLRRSIVSGSARGAVRPNDLGIRLELQERLVVALAGARVLRKGERRMVSSRLVDASCEVGKGLCRDILCLVRWVGVRHAVVHGHFAKFLGRLWVAIQGLCLGWGRIPGITAASSPGPATQAIIFVEIGRTAPRAAPTINGARPPHHIPTRPRSAHVSHSPAWPARRPPPAARPAPRPPYHPKNGLPAAWARSQNPPIVGTHMHHRALRCHQRPLGHARFPARPLPRPPTRHRHQFRLDMGGPKSPSNAGTHITRGCTTIAK
ncbi:hypothetical protein B0H14DRAFT_3487414 [Mycena olivaceomarginata]|nr:hypothetical protein B0H14DRAFT_3487414 [Mycena olivaceomarginata]